MNIYDFGVYNNVLRIVTVIDYELTLHSRYIHLYGPNLTRDL